MFVNVPHLRPQTLCGIKTSLGKVLMLPLSAELRDSFPAARNFRKPGVFATALGGTLWAD